MHTPSSDIEIKLPHISKIGYYQFLTFRTFDSVDDYLQKLQKEQIKDSIKQYRIDRYLDSSNKGAYLFDDLVLKIKDVLMQKDNELYEMIIFCIMPNHLHILLRQKSELEKIIKYIKGKSAIEINKSLNRNGRFWENGYFDRAIRDDRHFLKTYEYILNNPIKAGLSDWKERVYSKYEIDFS